MGPAVIFEDTDTFDDGTRYAMIATAVPESEEYPEGVKYRFQYMAEDGRTLLRFDNYPNHPGVDRHHYHAPDGVHSIDYGGLRNHVERFLDEVDARREGRR